MVRAQLRHRRCNIAPTRPRPRYQQMPKHQMAHEDRAARDKRAWKRALAKIQRDNDKLREEAVKLHEIVQGYREVEFQMAEHEEHQRQLEEFQLSVSTPRSPPPAPFEDDYEDDAPTTPPVRSGHLSTPATPCKPWCTSDRLCCVT